MTREEAIEKALRRQATRGLPGYCQSLLDFEAGFDAGAEWQRSQPVQCEHRTQQLSYVHPPTGKCLVCHKLVQEPKL
jgi:hypothetical protein